MGNSSDIRMKVWFLFTTAYEITLLYHTSFYTNHTSQAWILRNHTSEVWLKVWFHESHFYHTFKVCSQIFFCMGGSEIIFPIGSKLLNTIPPILKKSTPKNVECLKALCWNHCCFCYISMIWSYILKFVIICQWH